MKKNIEALLLAAVHNDTGIYPAVFVKGNEKTERTAWQDGWNACLIEMTDKWGKMNKWYKSLPEETQSIVFEMLEEDILLLSIDDAMVSPWILMNDTFSYASADGEDVSIDELPLVANIWKQYKQNGLIAWAAKKRGFQPIKKYLTGEYKIVEAAIEKLIGQ